MSTIETRSPLISKFINNRSLNRFYIIKKFNVAESRLIINTLKGLNGKSIFFDDRSGSIAILDEKSTTGATDFKYLNKINNPPREPSKSDTDKITANANQTIFYSLPNGRYILAITTDTNFPVYMFYNTIMSPDMIDYLKQAESTAIGYILTLCKEVGGKDPVCVCLDGNSDDTKFCMDHMFNDDKLLRKTTSENPGTKQGYYDMEKVCGCTTTECPSKSHPLMITYFSGPRQCTANSTVVMCNVNVSAAGQGSLVATDNMNISQKCSAATGTSENPKSNDNKQEAFDTPESEKNSGDGGSGSGGSDGDKENAKGASGLKSKNIIIAASVGAGLILILTIVGIIVYMKSSRNPAPSYSETE